MDRESALRELRRLRAEANMAINAANVTIDRELWRGYEKILALSEEYEQRADERFSRSTTPEAQLEVAMLRAAASCLREMSKEYVGLVIEQREPIPHV